MNSKKIEELAYGAEVWSKEGDFQVDLEVFAKLIIQEAMGIVFDEVSYISDWDSANAVIAKVEEHFGVDYER